MIVKMNRVTKAYDRNQGLVDLDLEVAPGEILGVLGLNGAGKTTLLKLLGGLIFPSQGSILVNDKPPRQNFSSISYHSDQDTLDEWMTPSLAAKVTADLYPDFDLPKYNNLILAMSVPNKMAGEMSKGERAKLRIALTMSRRARLFILDEPLSGLDIISKKQIIQTIVREWREDAALLLSTHEIDLVENIFERVLILKSGRAIFHDSVEKIRNNGLTLVDYFIGAMS